MLQQITEVAKLHFCVFNICTLIQTISLSVTFANYFDKIYLPYNKYALDRDNACANLFRCITYSTAQLLYTQHNTKYVFLLQFQNLILDKKWKYNFKHVGEKIRE